MSSNNGRNIDDRDGGQRDRAATWDGTGVGTSGRGDTCPTARTSPAGPLVWLRNFVPSASARWGAPRRAHASNWRSVSWAARPALPLIGHRGWHQVDLAGVEAQQGASFLAAMLARSVPIPFTATRRTYAAARSPGHAGAGPCRRCTTATALRRPAMGRGRLAVSRSIHRHRLPQACKPRAPLVHRWPGGECPV